MKFCLGLFLFSINTVQANSVQLMLRARVPASYSVSQNKFNRPTVKSNQAKNQFFDPEIKFFKDKKFYTITIVQP